MNVLAYSFLIALFCYSGPIIHLASANELKNKQVPKVVNGDAVSNGKYKFIVALQRLDLKDRGDPTGHWCGGTLLSTKYVLTAAHCVAEINKDGSLVVTNMSLITAVMGMTEYGLGQGKERRIASIKIHPQYGESGVDDGYDVAILELDQKISGLPKVKLAMSGDDLPGVFATVAGWGNIVAQYPDYEPAPLYSKEMRSVDLPIITNETCEKAYGRNFNGDLQLCTYLPARGDCQGDSGGPLFIKKKGRALQIGITSWGEGCAAPGKPNVYTRISNPSVQRFIQSAISQK